MATKQLGIPASGPTDASTKGYVDSTTTPGVSVVSGKETIGTLLQTHAESASPVLMPHLINDIAYNSLRGGSHTITRNGTTITQGDLDNAYLPDLSVVHLANNVTALSDVIVIEVTLCVPIQYSFAVGAAMTDWGMAQNVKIESYDATAGYTLLAVTTNDVNSHGHTWVNTGNANLVTKIRFTLTNFLNVDARITSLWVMAFNSPLLTGPFLPRGGGTLYGDITVPNAYVNYPTQDAHAARKQYVDVQDAGVVTTAGTNAATAITSERTAAATLTNKTLTAPILSGALTGTYTLGGTPTFPAAVVQLTTAQTLTSKTLTAPTLSGTVAGTYTLGGTPTFPAAVAQLTTVQTLTNKAITPRVNTTVSSATPTITVTTTDMYTITALAVAITGFTISGTPVDGQKLLVRIKDNGTAQAIAWGTSFISSGVATLLSTTVAGKTHMSGFVYDAVAAKFVLLAVDVAGY